MSTTTPTTAERIAERLREERLLDIEPYDQPTQLEVLADTVLVISTELERERQQVRDTLDRIYRTALISNAKNPVCREWLISETKAARAMLGPSREGK